MKYDKPVLLISNPKSGDHNQAFKVKVKQHLTSHDIQFDLYETEGQNSALRKASTLDVKNYSAILVAGGDGTIHEVVNGLMAREDRKKLPLGLIPKGTGNDLCYGLEIDGIQTALDYIS